MTSRIVLPCGRVLAGTVTWARTPRERARGLIGTAEPAPGAALVIERAPQVHTFGLAYPIDVVFCDRDWRVLRAVRRLRPRRATRWVWGARYAIEMAAGSLTHEVRPGTLLTVEE